MIDSSLSVTSRNLRVDFNDATVLTNISVQLLPGELIGLIGPNGAGKTTLLRSLIGLVSLVEGSVSIGNKDVQTWSKSALARRVSYLAQGQRVYWPLQAERLIALGRLPHLGPWSLPGRADRSAIADAMAFADVASLAQRTVTTLSVGELARVLLARALVSEPAVLLADEPAGNLDPGHALQVMRVFKDLAKSGRTVVVVLHDLTLAARFCDRLVLLKEGRLIGDGRPKEILTSRNLSLAYGVKAIINEKDEELIVVPWEPT